MAQAPNAGPADHLRALRRGVSRHRRLLAAGLAAAAVAAGIGAAAPNPPKRVGVLAAAHDLAAGKRLASGDLTTIRLRAGAVPDGALRPHVRVAGRTLAGPLRRGEPLTDVRLLGPGLLAHVGAPGLVVAPVRLADAASVHLLHPGDRVDVLAVDPSSGKGKSTTADVVARDLRVLTVPPTAVDESGGALVLLATTPAVAKTLAGAQVGARLSVTVRRRDAGKVPER
jgi:Flp pilus assembly protein CpaB